MRMMRALIVVLVTIVLAGCLPLAIIAESPQPPEWQAPSIPTISPTEQLICSDSQFPLLTDDLVDTQVIGCDVIVRDAGIRLVGCEFIDSRLLVEGAIDLVIEDCVFRDRYRHEEAAINFYQAVRPTVRRCLIANNYIGIGAHESVDVRIDGCTFRDNDGHNAIAIDLGATGTIQNCFFTNSFPHAILVGTGQPQGSVVIDNNWIEYSVEDAVNLENFSSSEPSVVRRNIILHTAWAGINVEYLSWNANVIVEDNYIAHSGTDLGVFPQHPHQPEPYSEGWKHGILIEDSSGVIVRDNMIVECRETGIELVNAQDVELESNHIIGCNVGIALRNYNEGSLTRSIFPLPTSQAATSRATAQGNTFEANGVTDWEIEPGCELQ